MATFVRYDASGVRALREAHNFSNGVLVSCPAPFHARGKGAGHEINGVHTLRQDEALHGFMALSSTDQQLINCKGWPVML